MNNYLKEINDIEIKYNLLFNKDKLVLEGNLFIYEYDCYQISIDISPFPNFFPIVKELGERIPFNVDRHKYHDASCCLTTKAKEQLLLKKKIKTLDNFIEKIVIPFFENNSYYEINKEYIDGGYSHGIVGVFEAYKEITNISDLKVLIDFLINRINSKKYQRNEKCFCNSGKKFKNCHLSNYNDLFLIDKEIIISDLKQLIDSVKNK